MGVCVKNLPNSFGPSDNPETVLLGVLYHISYHTSIHWNQPFIEILNEELLQYMVVRAVGIESIEMLQIFTKCHTLQLPDPINVLLDGCSTRGKKELLKKEPLHINPTSDSSVVQVE